MSAPISEQPSFISLLPEELLVGIFRYLSPLERPDSAVVSTVWNRLVTDRSLWPKSLDTLKCNVIDESVYKQHALQLIEQGNLTFEGVQPIAQDDIFAIMKVTKFYARLQAAGTSIEGDLGVTILTIPNGLSIKLIHAVFSDRINTIWDRILEVLGDAKVEKAYQVIIANNVLEGTRGKAFEMQTPFVGQAQCVVPKVIEAMTLALLTEKSTSTLTRLFNNNPPTSTRCIEEITWPLVVGNFATFGLSAMNGEFGYEGEGAACLRNF